MQKKMKQEIQNLLSRGVIRPSTSPYSASISEIEKKDGSIRICSAPISLNAVWTQNLILLEDAVASQKTWDPPQESHDQTSQTLLAGCSLTELNLAELSLAEPSLAEPSLAESSLAETSQAKLSFDQPAVYDWWI